MDRRELSGGIMSINDLSGGDMNNVIQMIKPKSKTEEAIEIIRFLNEKAGRNYRPTPVNLKFILARFKEGYTTQDIKSVIAMKVREWQHDDVMSKYLRPATLFNCEKFNQYAGELND